mgnify:CR=1 FL=1
MKYCEKCGKENIDENKFCISCGQKFENNIQEENVEEVIAEEENYNVENVSLYKPKEVNTLANLSFILGIISIGCFGVPVGLPFGIVISLFAITTGIISLVRKRKINTTKAILGLVFGSVTLIVSIIMFIVIGPIIDFIKELISTYCWENQDYDECMFLNELFPNLFQ